MKLLNLFKRKKTEIVHPDKPDLDDLGTARTEEDYLRQGWAYHSRKLEDKAEADFRQALGIDPQNVDANYSLGLVLRAQGMKAKALSYFKKTLELLEAGSVDDPARTEILRRLTKDYINELSEGNQKMEEQFWHHKK